MFAANTVVVTLLLLFALIVLGVLFARWLGARRPSGRSIAEQRADPAALAPLEVEPLEVQLPEVQLPEVELPAVVGDSDDRVSVGAAAEAGDAPVAGDQEAGEEATGAIATETVALLRDEPGIVIAVEPVAVGSESTVDAGVPALDGDAPVAAEGVQSDVADPLLAGFAEGWHDGDANDDVDANDDQVVARLDRAASLHITLEQARSRVQQLEDERQANLEGLDQVAREYRRRGALVRTLRADVASSEEQSSALEGELAAARERTSRLEDEQMALLRRAEAGEYLSVQLNAQLDGVHDELERSRLSTSELQKAIDERDGRVGDLETAVASIAAERRAVQSSLAGRDERVRRLEQSLSERDGRLRSVESELAELSGRIVELEAGSAGP